MPTIVEKIKVCNLYLIKINFNFKNRIKMDIEKSDYLSLTTDSWSSRDGAHSLLSLTCHFVQNGDPKFVVLSAKPIKGL